MKNRILKWLIFSLIICILCLSTTYFLVYCAPKPPIKEMEAARETLSKAIKFKADTYSKKWYAQAKVSYDSAMAHWKRENQRFIFSRNYSKVASFAKISYNKATKAIRNAKINSGNLKVNLKEQIDSLNHLVLTINQLFNRFPLPGEIRSHISKGKFLLKEGELLFSKGQYLPARFKIEKSENLLVDSYDYAMHNLYKYFESYPKWHRWAETTIDESKKNQEYSIIIDKFSGKCFIYKSGEKKYEFKSEFGRNWVGTKRLMGDNATPEGMYRIIKKIPCNKTKYYKALLIDYPNSDDIGIFTQELTRGTLPSSAKIGGLIEIHGNGGKGSDWTKGCIALHDSDMDIVYKIADVGTPVTIIGSMNRLSQILSR